MKKRNWTGLEKLEIVLEGLKDATTLASADFDESGQRFRFYLGTDS